jgi:hydrogenase maturation protease
MSCDERASNDEILVLGVGNTLLCDDGLGVHVANALRSRTGLAENIRVIDGGTLGLSLLPDVEDAAGVIVVDAAEIGARPGTVRVFEDAAMDDQLRGKKRTVHEVAVADLLAAATLTGRPPRERAMVAVQPKSTDWSLEPTSDVQSAISKAADTVVAIAARWAM